jgi:membrane protein HdeD
MAGSNVWSGIFAILLGILIIAFPLFSVFTLSVLTGLGLIFIGFWLIAMAFGTWSSSKGMSIAALILGIIGIVIGIGLFGSIMAFSIFVSLAIYLVGFFLVLAGIFALLSGMGPSGRWGGLLGIIMGIIYIIVGFYALNPLYLAALIGIFLIISGIFQIFMPAEE